VEHQAIPDIVGCQLLPFGKLKFYKAGEEPEAWKKAKKKHDRDNRV
jgi:hypothetical protein